MRRLAVVLVLTGAAFLFSPLPGADARPRQYPRPYVAPTVYTPPRQLPPGVIVYPQPFPQVYPTVPYSYYPYVPTFSGGSYYQSRSYYYYSSPYGSYYQYSNPGFYFYYRVR